jgi:hypothetical protein
VFEPPLAVDGLDSPPGVLRDLAATVRPEAGVVVDGVIGEVGGDQVRVARIERLVIRANVVEVADDGILTAACRFGVGCSSLG